MIVGHRRDLSTLGNVYMKFKKGDEIIITTGKDRGKKGKIDKIFPKKNIVLVPGLNIYKRHTKRRDEKTPGGIIEFSRPLPVGNFALVCPKCHVPTRIGMRMEGADTMRICRKCQAVI